MVSDDCLVRITNNLASTWVQQHRTIGYSLNSNSDHHIKVERRFDKQEKILYLEKG